MDELSKQQEALGKQQEELGKQQQALGKQMEAVRMAVPAGLIQRMQRWKPNYRPLADRRI